MDVENLSGYGGWNYNAKNGWLYLGYWTNSKNSKKKITKFTGHFGTGSGYFYYPKTSQAQQVDGNGGSITFQLCMSKTGQSSPGEDLKESDEYTTTKVITPHTDDYPDLRQFSSAMEISFSESIELGSGETVYFYAKRTGGTGNVFVYNNGADWSGLTPPQITIEDAIVYHTVTYKDKENGTTIATQSVQDGSVPTPPPDPTWSGYTFTGWSYTGAITAPTTIWGLWSNYNLWRYDSSTGQWKPYVTQARPSEVQYIWVYSAAQSKWIKAKKVYKRTNGSWQSIET